MLLRTSVGVVVFVTWPRKASMPVFADSCLLVKDPQQ